MYPGYTPKSKYKDIALIELEESVEFTEFVKPICLQVDNDVDDKQRNFTIIGFGTIKANTSKFVDDVKHFVLILHIQRQKITLAVESCDSRNGFERMQVDFKIE